MAQSNSDGRDGDRRHPPAVEDSAEPQDGVPSETGALAQPAGSGLEGGSHGNPNDGQKGRDRRSESTRSDTGKQAVADADEPRPGEGRSPTEGRAEPEFNADWWTVEPDVGRVASRISSRVDRLRGLGNAVVPQVAEVIGRWIMEIR